MSFLILFGPNGEPFSSLFKWGKYEANQKRHSTFEFDASTTRGFTIFYGDSYLYNNGYILQNAHQINVTYNTSVSNLDVIKGKYWRTSEQDKSFVYYTGVNETITRQQITTSRRAFYFPLDYTERGKGEFIENVTAGDRNAYPDAGEQDNFYYEYVGEEAGESFLGNGYGMLTDAADCRIVNVLNGEYELQMIYPEDGEHAAELQDDCILTCRSGVSGEPQPFRIYRHTVPMGGMVTWYARHLAYDMMGNVVTPFAASSAATALAGLAGHSVPELGFTLSTDKSTAAAFEVKVPTPLWTALGGSSGSILDVYGGEYELDRNSVILHNRRGSDRGVTIRYGVNLTDWEMDRNIEAVYTAVLPFWTGGDQTVTGNPVNVPGTWAHVRMMPLDLSSEFETAPTAQQLTTAAEDYIDTHGVGLPDVSWKISFVMLSQTEEYKNQAFLEQIELGDTVHVVFDKQGVEATARAVSYEWNVLLDRYDSVTLGSVKANMASTVAAQDKAIADKPSISLTEKIAGDLAKAFTGLLGGSVRILDTNGDGMPDELYIADDPDPTLAQRVWRWNYEGLAASKNGYEGDFITGMTIDGGIMSWLVTAANIVAGFIHSQSGDFQIDLDNGILLTVARKTYLARNYTSADATRANQIVVGSVTPTASDYEKYDFYGDGKITISDVVICGRLAESSIDLTVEWKVSISPQETGTCLKTIMKTTGLMQSETITFSAGAGATKTRDLWVENELLLKGEPVIGKKIIGYVVSASGTSGYPVANFYPVGFSGTYMISSDDWYIRFTLNTEQGTATKTAGSSGTSIDSVTPVYNF